MFFMNAPTAGRASTTLLECAAATDGSTGEPVLPLLLAKVPSANYNLK